MPLNVILFQGPIPKGQEGLAYLYPLYFIQNGNNFSALFIVNNPYIRVSRNYVIPNRYPIGLFSNQASGVVFYRPDGILPHLSIKDYPKPLQSSFAAMFSFRAFLGPFFIIRTHFFSFLPFIFLIYLPHSQ